RHRVERGRVTAAAAALGPVNREPPGGLARTGALVHQRHRQRVALAQLAGEALGALAVGLVAVVQGHWIPDHQGVWAPFLAQAVDGAPVGRAVVHVDHRQRARAVAEAAAHRHPDAPGADVEAEYGATAGDAACAHARPE